MTANKKRTDPLFAIQKNYYECINNCPILT